MSARVVTVNEVLGGHVALDIECLDRFTRTGWRRRPRKEHGSSWSVLMMITTRF